MISGVQCLTIAMVCVQSCLFCCTTAVARVSCVIRITLHTLGSMARPPACLACSAAPVLPEQPKPPDHDRLSTWKTATTAASGKSRAAVGCQSIRPPKGRPGKSDRRHQYSATSQTRHSTHKRPKRVSATTTLGTNDPLRQMTRKRRHNPRLSQDDIWARWRRLNDGGRGCT
jgi:hypothetical protein